ncbi:MAG: hypothetical protein ABSF79_03295 [Smithellaceae bacterium]|jgi:hypothetical protein
MLPLKLDIDVQLFEDSLKTRIQTLGSQTITELLCDLVVAQFESHLKELVTAGKILRFKIYSPCGYYDNGKYKPGLKALTKQKTIDLGRISVTIVTPLSCDIRLATPSHLLWQAPVEFKKQSLKTIKKHIFNMYAVAIRADVIEPVSNTLSAECQCEPDSLVPYIDGAWDWALRFICKICGKSYFCECFRRALDIQYPNALEQQRNYGEQGWPHKFVAAYNQSEFKANICHLCRDIPSDLHYCEPAYGSKVMIHYGPYIERTSIEKGIDKREAENELRDILGIPRVGEGWISELELLKMIQSIFPNEKIIHEARPLWLGLQRLDIFIPGLKLAIEYQGLQHYEPVPFFGGEEGFSRTQSRDKRKADLCAENDVTLIYFRYDEEINRKMLEGRLISRKIESIDKRP